jgi:hypothetical protein
MLDFDSLAAAFDRKSSLTIYCAVRQLSSDLEATVYPAWLIKDYGEPFEESRSESADGSIDQVLLFSDCRNPDARQGVLNPWRYEADKAGAEVMRRGWTANQGFFHSETVEWVLTCMQHVPRSKTDFIDQYKFDIGKGLVTTLSNAWVTSHQVCRQLAKRDVPKGEAAGHEPQVSVQDGDGVFKDSHLVIWGGRRFEFLTPGQLRVVELLLDRYKTGRADVRISEICRIAKVQARGGFKQNVFKLNRKDWPPIHPVECIVVQSSQDTYRLIDPEKVPACS